jgi:two-component system, NarL family, response regulator DevR
MNTAKPKPPESRISVVIADDHLVVRLGLRALLDIHPRIKVVGEAATGPETLALVATAHPDVVLLDLRLPDVDGLEVCRRLKLGSPSPAVLFLTSYADDKTILAAIAAGADGYLLKAMAGQDIPSSILTVASGGSVLDPVVTRRVLSSVHPSKPVAGTKSPGELFESLTVQETRVMEQAALGKSNKQIAHELHLSEGTVRNYLSEVFAKLGVASRVEAALLWQRQSKT